MVVLGDWISVSKVDEKTYKPDMGVCILEEKNKKKDFGQYDWYVLKTVWNLNSLHIIIIFKNNYHEHANPHHSMISPSWAISK